MNGAQTAKITTAPSVTTLPDGYAVYTARAETEPWGQDMPIVMLPPTQGDALPYAKDDRVLIIVADGTGYVIGQFASSATHDGNRTIAPRGGKDVRVGSGSGDWEAFALHARLADEVINLKVQIDALALRLSTAANGSGPVAPDAVDIVDAATIEGGITGGDAASGAKGQKA